MGFSLAPIVFVGDSITEAWVQCRPDLFARHVFICRGIGGQTTRQIRARLYNDIVQSRARGLHLLCGINDIAGNDGYVTANYIQSNFAAMLQEVSDLNLKIWIGSIMPAEAIGWAPGLDPRSLIAELNDWLRVYAAKIGATYIDYHRILRNINYGLREEYGTDGVHLNRAGYCAIEATLLTAIFECPTRT